jgi:hypothetical protein
MRVSDDLVEQEWEAALLDADFNADDVVLWKCEGFHSSSGEAPACCYPAVLGVREDDPFLPALQQAGHDLDCEDRPRVALYLDVQKGDTDTCLSVRALVAGLLRHELEHVKQSLYWQPRLDYTS